MPLASQGRKAIQHSTITAFDLGLEQIQRPEIRQTALGSLPREGGRVEVLSSTVVNPVADCNAEGEKELEEGTKLAPDFLWSHFSRVDGDDDGGSAYSLTLWVSEMFNNAVWF